MSGPLSSPSGHITVTGPGIETGASLEGGVLPREITVSQVALERRFYQRMQAQHIGRVAAQAATHRATGGLSALLAWPETGENSGADTEGQKCHGNKMSPGDKPRHRV